jgi:NitT/TauT family transport system substrate-binding protein
MSRLRVAAVLAVLSVLLVACGSSPNAEHTSKAGDGGKGPVTVKYLQASDSFAYLPYYIASNEGYFKDQGITIDRQPNIGVSSQAAQSVLVGQADIAAVGTTGVYSLEAQGRPAKSVAALTQQSILELALRNDVVKKLKATTGTTPDSPIAQRVKALKGLKIAIVPEGAISRVQFEATLKTYGLNPDKDVKLIPIEDPDALVAAAKTGHTDGFVFSLPNTQAPVTDGWGQTWISYPRGDVPALKNNYLIDLETSASYLKSNPAVVKRFLTAMQKAFDLLKADPAAAKVAVKKSFPDMTDKLFNAAYGATLPAFTSGMVPTQAGFERTQKTWLPTQDHPKALTFGQVYDTTAVQAVAAQ